MGNPEETAQLAAERAGRAVRLITPDAKVNVETVNTSPGGPFEVLNLRAEFDDGTTVYIPRAIVNLA